MNSNISQFSSSSSSDSSTEYYTILLTLHYDLTSIPTTSNGDDVLVVDTNPDLEDEYIHEVKITLSNPNQAYISALETVNPDRTISSITISDAGGLDFSDDFGAGYPPRDWDSYLDVAILRTRRRMEEMETEEEDEVVLVNGVVEVDDGDEPYFGELDRDYEFAERGSENS